LIENGDELWPKLKDLPLQEVGIEAGRKADHLKSFWKLTNDIERIDPDRAC
jgi:hypothetical protein